MDPNFKKWKRKVANAMNSLEETPQNIQARTQIKAAQTERKVAFILLDADLHELFVRFFLSERIMDIFSSWVAYCKVKAEKRLKENLDDCIPDAGRYFIDVYKEDIMKIEIRQASLRERILKEIQKEAEKVSKEIEELQSYLIMLSRIK